MFRKSLIRLAGQRIQLNRSFAVPRFYAPKFTYTFSTEKHTFKAETKKLLDIVAKSLYTDKDVFVRELLSNASDALEKQRFLASQSDNPSTENLEIRIELDEERRVLTMWDTGVGMSKQEMIDNLGTIARSGSKQFLQDNNDNLIADKIIGQFGVGFYSTFIVGDTVEVTSRSEPENQAFIWTSDGSGTFEVSESEESNFPRGTRIRVYLKPESASFAKRSEIEKTIERYSNFISFPILINNDKLNLQQAIWSRSRNSISSEEYSKFFEFLTNSKMNYKYKLHYQTDAPMSIKALLYIPQTHAEKFGMTMEQFDVHLYSRKVLIKRNCRELLPNYLRFVKGVVDCEDIPLNISRENYQDTQLLAKLRSTITKRLIRELETEANKDPQAFLEWQNEFQFFLKEGIAQDSENAESLLKLLRFNHSKDDKAIGLEEYIKNAPKGQEQIYFLLAPSREHALSSPYLEPFKGTNIPVIFSFVHIDEMVFRQVGDFKGFKFVNIESQQSELKSVFKDVEHDTSKGLSSDEVAPFSLWLKNELQPTITQIEISKRLTNTPAIVVSAISSGVRQVLSMVDKAQAATLNQNLTLEVNPNHNIIIQLNRVRKINMSLASLVAKQLLDNCLIISGLVNDPQSIVDRNLKLMEIVIQSAKEAPQVEESGETRRSKRESKKVQDENVEVIIDEQGRPSIKSK